MKPILPALISATTALTLAGCATVHPGNVGMALSGSGDLPLKISADVAQRQVGESFAVIYLTFENLGDRWIRIDETQVEIGPTIADRVSVVVGKDLVDWVSAVEERAKLRAHNDAIVVGSIAVVGAAASGLTQGSDSTTGKTVNAVGGIALAGALTYAVGDTIGSARSAVESPRKVPDNHVYQPFAVPGKLFIRKWLLINKPSNETITQLVFNIKTVDGEKAQYAVEL